MTMFKSKSFSLLMSNFLWLMFSLSLIPLTLVLFFNQSFLLTWEIQLISSISVEMSIIVDLYGSLFSTTVLLISSSVVTFSVNYMSEDPNIKRFIMVVLLFILSMNLLVYIPNVVAILLGWDGLGIVSFVLVIYYQNPNSLGAGMVTALANRVGDVMLIISIAWMTTQGHWSILSMFETNYNSALTAAILLAAMTKSAQIPFSSWLPAAMAAPTPVSALVHSSTLVTAGVFLIIRFYWFLEKALWFAPVCLGVASLTCLMAGLCAMQEFDMKKIIALSTLSQLGVMMTSLGLGAMNVAYFHMITHALFKALLFICAGNVIHQHSGSQDIRFMGNLWKTLPSTSACLNTANLALCGLPFMAGFYSKDLILEIFFMKEESLIMLLIIIISTLLTLMYSLRFSIFVVWGGHKKASYYMTGDEDKNVNLAEQVLSLGAIFGGAVFSWVLFSYPSAIILTTMQKMLIISSLGLTLLLILMLEKYIFFSKSTLMSGFSNLLSNSLSSMWFLSILFGKSATYLGLSSSFILMKVSDQGWSEIFGGQGAFSLSKTFGKKIKEGQNQLVSMFLFMSFIGLFFIFMMM
uniref:NADH-ubiquinone oxidoreductase chain 5 n=1 Tax=Phoronis psammophila TaxID=67897 RepID=Q6UKF7_9BILA|nr:NADH dehydrogenase subunit 5 [Phoronis architecta]